MPASSYVRTYLEIWTWINDTYTVARIRNYLQDGKAPQSDRAAAAYSRLVQALRRQPGLTSGPLPAVFTVQGDQYASMSLWRVYHGKGAPDEIQDALWLASVCGLVDENNLATYCDQNLGIDCGGFVANYWGIGRPSLTQPNPNGATGFKPRTIWGLAPSLRRARPEDIAVDDAAIFFQDVKNDDPNIAAHQIAGGGYDTTSGSQAFHIGLVSAVSVVPGSTDINLEIAESSGATAASGGNGVNVRPLGRVSTTVARHLVWCPSGRNRIYFTGKQGNVSPYMPNLYGL